jgi:hypothetical protein
LEHEHRQRSGHPTVAIFVRHSKDCQHRDDYFYKKCKCRKHLRWTQNGKQITASAKTRTWSEAEKAKRAVEDELEKATLRRASRSKRTHASRWPR